MECADCGKEIDKKNTYKNEFDENICYDCWIGDDNGFETNISECW